MALWETRPRAGGAFSAWSYLTVQYRDNIPFALAQIRAQVEHLLPY